MNDWVNVIDRQIRESPDEGALSAADLGPDLFRELRRFRLCEATISLQTPRVELLGDRLRIEADSMDLPACGGQARVRPVLHLFELDGARCCLAVLRPYDDGFELIWGYLAALGKAPPELSWVFESAEALIYSSVGGADLDRAGITSLDWPEAIALADLCPGVTLAGAGRAIEDNMLAETVGALKATLGDGAARLVVRSLAAFELPPPSEGERAEEEDEALEGGEAPEDVEELEDGEAQDDALVIELAIPAKIGGGRLGGVAIGAEITEVKLLFAVGARLAIAPRIAVAGEVTLGTITLAVEAVYDHWAETVTCRLVRPIRLQDLLLFVTGEDAYLPDILAKLAEVEIADAWVIASLDGPGGGVIGAGLFLAARDVPFFDGFVRFDPEVRLWLEAPLSPENRELHGILQGAVRIGNVAELTGKLEMPEGRFRVAADVRLEDLAEALRLPKDPVLSCLLAHDVAFELVGDPAESTYCARVVLDRSQTVEMDSAPWQMRSIEVTITTGARADPTLDIAACLTIAAQDFWVEGRLDNGWHLRGVNERPINFAEVVGTLFESTELPDGLATLVLDDVALTADTATGDFELTARTAQPWTIAEKLSVDITEFHFEKFEPKDAESSGSAAGLAGIISLDSLRLRVAARKERLSGTWRFEGGTVPGVGLSFSDVVTRMARALDLKDAPDVPGVLEKQKVDQLAVSFERPGDDIRFDCALSLDVDGTPVTARVRLVSATQPGAGPEDQPQRTLEFEADVLIQELHVAGKFQRIADESRLIAAVAETENAAGDEDRATSVSLDKLAASLVPALAGSLPETEMALDQAIFVHGGKGTLFEVDLAVAASLDLSVLPAIKALMGDARVGIERVGAVYATADFDADAVAEIDGLLPTPARVISAGKAGVEKGLAVTVGMRLSDHTLALRLPLTGAGATEASETRDEMRAEEPTDRGGDSISTGATGQATAPAGEADGAGWGGGRGTRKWFSVGKSLGPLHLGRVGAEYELKDRTVGLLFDAGVDLAGLHMGLSGLALHVPIQPDPVPWMGLDGLDVSYSGGPVEITGAFLRVQERDKPDRYDGFALLKAPNFAITGFGSYTTIAGAGSASLFIFATLHARLGGPPFFQVEGLSAGFGYNRSLLLPGVDEVEDFPLVRASLDENFIAGNTPSEAAQMALAKLGSCIAPAEAEYWIAAGVKFNSFEFIRSVALLTVSFGGDVEIGILGLSRMRLPREPDQAEIGCIELALRASIKPEAGTVQVEGRLTKASYILTKKCRLTGGFAFHLWFAGTHSGDFVITLGGYSPKFDVPEHYPVVPRLGIQWQVSSELAVDSELYFALTPSCIMAGGRLAATYRNSWVRAWFVAHADFYIQWQPLLYSAEMGLRLGVEADLTLSTVHVEIGVTMRLWGPPFGGLIHVDLTVVSFDIELGGACPKRPDISAQDFCAAFLPDDQAVVGLHVGAGLIHQQQVQGETQDLHLVNAHALGLVVQSQVPLTGVKVVGAVDSAIGPLVDRSDEVFEQGEDHRHRLGIAPMRTTSLGAEMIVTIERTDAVGEAAEEGLQDDLQRLTLTPRRMGAPSALWAGSPPEAAAGDAGRDRGDGETTGAVVTAVMGAFLSFAPAEPVGPLDWMKISPEARETIEKTLTPPIEKAKVEREMLNAAALFEALKDYDAAPEDEACLETIRRIRATQDRWAGYFQTRPEICPLGAPREAA